MTSSKLPKRQRPLYRPKCRPAARWTSTAKGTRNHEPVDVVLAEREVVAQGGGEAEGGDDGDRVEQGMDRPPVTGDQDGQPGLDADLLRVRVHLVLLPASHAPPPFAWLAAPDVSSGMSLTAARSRPTKSPRPPARSHRDGACQAGAVMDEAPGAVRPGLAQADPEPSDVPSARLERRSDGVAHGAAVGRQDHHRQRPGRAPHRRRLPGGGPRRRRASARSWGRSWASAREDRDRNVRRVGLRGRAPQPPRRGRGVRPRVALPVDTGRGAGRPTGTVLRGARGRAGLGVRRAGREGAVRPPVCGGHERPHRRRRPLRAPPPARAGGPHPHPDRRRGSVQAVWDALPR